MAGSETYTGAAPRRHSVLIIGAGPAGLMAAEQLAPVADVTIIDHKKRPARKFLMAGRGGLNLTHSENLDDFISRYGEAASWLAPMIRAFPPAALRDWSAGLGEDTFVGSTGRVFPRSFKAAPLLQAWQGRLDAYGVHTHYGSRWAGWDGDGAVCCVEETGQEITYKPDALLLALGGASWPRLGSDGGWVELLARRGVQCVPLCPANCGFAAQWPDFFAEKYAGTPLKNITAGFAGRTVPGEAMITRTGIEGGVIYALSAALRDAVARDGRAALILDLRPGLSLAALAARLAPPHGRNSFANILKKKAGLAPAAAALVRVACPEAPSLPPDALAMRIKALPLVLHASFAIGRAISSAGGIGRDELTPDLMLRRLPGVFAAGEMIDWEAPTGGYLLQATYATAVRAAAGIQDYLARNGRITT